MTIKRNINGKDITITLSDKELNDAWWEVVSRELQKEARYSFDNILAENRDTHDKPRLNNEPGTIPGSEAYREAWVHVYLDSYAVWEGGRRVAEVYGQAPVPPVRRDDSRNHAPIRERDREMARGSPRCGQGVHPWRCDEGL